MEERRGDVQNHGGHVAVHGVECEICDKDRWDLGRLGCQTEIQRSFCHWCGELLRREGRRTTRGMPNLKGRNRYCWISTTRPQQRPCDLSSRERRIVHRCSSCGQPDSYVDVLRFMREFVPAGRLTLVVERLQGRSRRIDISHRLSGIVKKRASVPTRRYRWPGPGRGITEQTRRQIPSLRGRNLR